MSGYLQRLAQRTGMTKTVGGRDRKAPERSAINIAETHAYRSAADPVATGESEILAKAPFVDAVSRPAAEAGYDALDKVVSQPYGSTDEAPQASAHKDIPTSIDTAPRRDLIAERSNGSDSKPFAREAFPAFAATEDTSGGRYQDRASGGRLRQQDVRLESKSSSQFSLDRFAPVPKTESAHGPAERLRGPDMDRSAPFPPVPGPKGLTGFAPAAPSAMESAQDRNRGDHNVEIHIGAVNLELQQPPTPAVPVSYPKPAVHDRSRPTRESFGFRPSRYYLRGV